MLVADRNRRRNRHNKNDEIKTQKTHKTKMQPQTRVAESQIERMKRAEAEELAKLNENIQPVSEMIKIVENHQRDVTSELKKKKKKKKKKNKEEKSEEVVSDSDVHAYDAFYFHHVRQNFEKLYPDRCEALFTEAITKLEEMIKKTNDSWQGFLQLNKLNDVQITALYKDLFKHPIFIARSRYISSNTLIFSPEAITQLINDNPLCYTSWPEIFKMLVMLPNSSFQDFEEFMLIKSSLSKYAAIMQTNPEIKPTMPHVEKPSILNYITPTHPLFKETNILLFGSVKKNTS